VYLFLADGTRLREMRGPPGQALAAWRASPWTWGAASLSPSSNHRLEVCPAGPSVLRLRIHF